MAFRIQFRRDTSTNWASVNPTLAQGELGLETNTGKVKVGDGTTAWNALAYSFSGVTDHTLLSNIGTNTHAQIDTHIANTSNPHATTAVQVGADPTGTASSAVAAHVAALDPHTQYALESDVATALSGKANTSHTHALADLTISGASVGQVPKWNGTAWAPANDNDSGGAPAWGTITGTLSSQTDLQGALDAKQNVIAGSNSKFVYKDSTGVVKSLEAYNMTDLNELNINSNFEIDTGGNVNAEVRNFQANATEDSPSNNFQASHLQVNIDTDDDGFELGTTGTGVSVQSYSVQHQNKSDVGSINFITNNFNIGNGTDPIDVGGISYVFGFGQVNDNVTVSGVIQGYGFQLNVDPGATIENVTAFYDFANIGCEAQGYQSAAFGPTIESIANNNNYGGLSINPTIDTFTGNAGFIGVSVNGNLGTFNTNGYFHGVNVNPNITSARYAAGLQVSMDNVTPYAGLQSSLVFQDLTLTFNAAGDNDAFTLEYTSGATAGAEVVSILGNAITVQIEAGVSTATQVKNALDATINFNAAVTVTISGVGSNPQVVAGPTNFSGGENPGQILAAYLDGNVEITGNLTFGGALSIGKLNAFATDAIIDGGGTPLSIHSLVSNPTVPASATIANGDTLGINTAMLLTIGAGAAVTTSFVGVAALALPAVVTMGAGSTIDQVSGGTFAISLDPGGAGGTIDKLDLCRSIAIPNGVTTISNLRGYKFDLPFGDPGTKTHGFYEQPGVNNYFAGNLLIGGTPLSDDTVTNASVAFEIKSTTKAAVEARMTTTQRDAMTAINGMRIYNTTTDKFQGYAAGSWVDLH